MVFGKRCELHQEFSDNLAESARQFVHAIQDHDVGRAQHDPDPHRQSEDQLPAAGRKGDPVLDDVDALLDAIVVGRAIRSRYTLARRVDLTTQALKCHLAAVLHARSGYCVKE